MRCISKNGRTCYVAMTPDVDPNEGGFYCEVYRYQTYDYKIDDFVIHSGSDGDLPDCDCTNEEEVEKYAEKWVRENVII